jgi:ribosomal protein S18 acetylase RimI-like enzyme
MPEPSIQPLAEPDLAQFMPLLGEIECGRHYSPDNPAHVHWLEQTIRAHLACGARFFGCRSDDARPMGIVGIVIRSSLFSPPTAEIVDIGVASGSRRRGIGTALLDYALTLAQQADAHAVFARTYAADAGVIVFYGRRGFCPVAVIPDTNGPHDEGTIVMRRRLTGSAGGRFSG